MSLLRALTSVYAREAIFLLTLGEIIRSMASTCSCGIEPGAGHA
jgi:hypothetical protein